MNFEKRINELLKVASFCKILIYKSLWNFISRKTGVFIAGIIFLYSDKIDQNIFLIICGLYVGANIYDKIQGRNEENGK